MSKNNTQSSTVFHVSIRNKFPDTPGHGYRGPPAIVLQVCGNVVDLERAVGFVGPAVLF